MKIQLLNPKTLLRGVTATLFLAATVVAFGQTAQEDNDPTSPYVGKTYKYLDANGQEHEVPYLQRVTDLRQMQSLIASVYADKTIPGQKKVIGQNGEVDVQYHLVKNRPSTWNKVEYNVVGEFTISSWKENKDETATTHINYPSAFWKRYSDETQGIKVPAFVAVSNTTLHKPKAVLTQKNSNKTRESSFCEYYNVTPNEEGKTALLIEMKDDYMNTIAEDFAESWSYIKAVSVIPLDHQMHIDVKEGTSVNPYKSGTLINITGKLNKFFILLKGDIYGRYGKNAEGNDTFFAVDPFYYAYEQISPIDNESNTDYVVNALEKMIPNADGVGQKFPVNHDCRSLTHNGHAICMKALDNTEEPTENYNILLYIPDGRFYGRDNYNYYQCGKNLTINGSDVTVGTDNGLPDLQPYMFINTLKLNSEVLQDGSMTDKVAYVKQDWTSSLRTVITQNEKETFRLTREIDGVETDVPMEDFIFDAYVKDGSVSAYDDRLVLRENDANTLVNIKEARYEYDHDVTYRVYGRILCENGKDFEWVISNEVTVSIPGTEHLTNPDLKIALQHKSTFDKDAQKNAYENTVNFLVRGPEKSDMALKKAHIDNETVFVLRRFKNIVSNFTYDNNEEGAKTVATITVEELGTENGHDFVKMHLTDNQGLGNNKYFTLVTTDNAGETEYTLEGQTAENDIWCTYVDKDTYDVKSAGHADGSNYSYRLFGVNVKNFKDVATGDKIESGNLLSNRVTKRMPRIDHDYAVTDYTLDEIKADANGTKALSVSDPCHVVTTQVAGNANISCDIETIGDDKFMAELKYDTQGSWHLTSYKNTTGKVFLADDAEVGSNVVLKARANEAASYYYVVMTIKDCQNTYGTPRIKAPRLPKVIITEPQITHNGSAHDINFDLSVSHENDTEYLSHGFGVWGYDILAATEFLPQDNSIISDLRHHKHAVDNTNTKFTYTGGDVTSATDVYEDKALSTVKAHVLDTRTGVAGTAEKPYSAWYRVRYYAKRANTTSAAPGENRAVAIDDPRYVIVESVAGSNYQDGNSTGVEDVIAEPESEIDAIYSLQGMRVNNPEAGHIYIVVRGTKATKQIWR